MSRISNWSVFKLLVAYFCAKLVVAVLIIAMAVCASFFHVDYAWVMKFLDGVSGVVTGASVFSPEAGAEIAGTMSAAAIIQIPMLAALFMRSVVMIRVMAAVLFVISLGSTMWPLQAIVAIMSFSNELRDYCFQYKANQDGGTV